ncbi:MAG: sulfurtransferase [Deltaproteobacteria bacterium]|nr:MAG: sulfurtransferase [Deltaproteobacteria bacterium]
MQREKDLVLLDVRERHELDLARIDSAVHIPMGEIVSRYRELDPSAHIVVMCHHGIRSWNVARFLVERAGFRHVDNLSGGIDAWALEVDPTTPRY